MGFHEIRFPANLSFGSVGGPERRTEVVTLANGHEERNTPWAHSRRRYDAGLSLRSLDDIETLVAFFEARRGMLYGFRWKDWTDYKSCSASKDPDFRDQVIGIGDGETRVWQLGKHYASGGSDYLRPIRKPVAGTVTLGIQREPLQESLHWEMDATTGLITFAVAPEAGVEITAGYEFDVPVRFDTDQIRTSVAAFKAGEVPSVPVLELRL
ncbi:DUF2460 domain-containing protein [Frigidibacter sp. ROC022]|uniref:DUF2460 domain-containing protein n=1 Tax=Frigidibacter sp. ROC022 TaxID=2971796 RepID=UPI00215AF40E|nr:DUF2460 domain-containing protein [Frigidibacter sp. ROC022]MCR8723633.1 DUF2460 domain-containing protein [Frigidibacter sp. ROC022]